MGTPELLLDFAFVSRPDRLLPMRWAVREALVSAGCEADEREEMVLAVNEACANVIRHGYENRPDGPIRLQIHRQGNVLVFQLQDQAPPVDVSNVHPRALDEIRPGGLGTHLMREIMDDVVFLQPPEGNGNLLQMTRTLRKCGCMDDL